MSTTTSDLAQQTFASLVTSFLSMKLTTTARLPVWASLLPLPKRLIGCLFTGWLVVCLLVGRSVSRITQKLLSTDIHET